MAGELLMSISQDERERAIFRSRRMYRSDLESDMRTAEKVGIAKGLVEGRAEGRAEGWIEAQIAMAKSLLGAGDSIERVITITNLTRAEVEALRDAD